MTDGIKTPLDMPHPTAPKLQPSFQNSVLQSNDGVRPDDLSDGLVRVRPAHFYSSGIDPAPTWHAGVLSIRALVHRCHPAHELQFPPPLVVTGLLRQSPLAGQSLSSSITSSERGV
jgi:hypothetical protein